MNTLVLIMGLVIVALAVTCVGLMTHLVLARREIKAQREFLGELKSIDVRPDECPCPSCRERRAIGLILNSLDRSIR